MVLGIDEYLLEDRKDKDIEFLVFKKYYQRIYKGTGCQYKEWIEEIRKNYERYIVYNERLDQYNKQLDERHRQSFHMPIGYQKIPNENEYFTIREKGLEKHHLYIFGHSLDITDRDILRELILNDNIMTTIYYNKSYEKNGEHDNGRKSLGEKIANLVKVIGQDELIRKTGGSTKTIEFKLQQDMDIVAQQV